MLKDKRKRPLFIKSNNGKWYQSYYMKNELHFCRGYHLVLDKNVILRSYDSDIERFIER